MQGFSPSPPKDMSFGFRLSGVILSGHVMLSRQTETNGMKKMKSEKIKAQVDAMADRPFYGIGPNLQSGRGTSRATARPILVLLWTIMHLHPAFLVGQTFFLLFA